MLVQEMSRRQSKVRHFLVIAKRVLGLALLIPTCHDRGQGDLSEEVIFTDKGEIGRPAEVDLNFRSLFFSYEK